MASSSRRRVNLHRLAKQRGGRLEHVATFEATCELRKAEKPTDGWLVGSRSLKTAEESDEFVHVMAARMRAGISDPVIVKLQEHQDPLRKKEREMFLAMAPRQYRNVVRRLCSFSCPETKLHWRGPKPEGTPFCRGGSDLLHATVYEHIDRDLAEEMDRDLLGTDEVISCAVQLCCTLVSLRIHHQITHGDINRGNVLLERDNGVADTTYDIGGHEITVSTCGGLRPVLIDFQRGSYHPGVTEPFEYLLDEPATLLYLMGRWSKDDALTQLLTGMYVELQRPVDLQGLAEVLSQWAQKIEAPLK